MIIWWVAGIVFIVAGLIWLALAGLQGEFNRLCRAEAEMMKRDGLFDGEEEYMRDFRIARAEWDIIDIGKYVKIGRVHIMIGTAIILYLIIFG